MPFNVGCQDVPGASHRLDDLACLRMVVARKLRSQATDLRVNRAPVPTKRAAAGQVKKLFALEHALRALNKG